MQEKQIVVMTAGMMLHAQADNILYALQTNLENRKNGIVDKFTSHVHVHDRYYDTAVKNKYYSQSYTLKEKGR